MRAYKRWAFRIIVGNFIFFYIYVSISIVKNFQQHDRSSGNDVDYYMAENGRKTILLWTKYAESTSLWLQVFQRQMFNECEENRCDFTSERDHLSKADAVLFNGNNLRRRNYRIKGDELPPGPRNPKQIFIFFSMEPPPKLHQIKLETYDNFFNWTMTFRRDSDVVVPYGKITKRKKEKSIEFISNEELRHKDLAMWMVSHCFTQSKRELLVPNLNRYMKVAQYGRCGGKKCGVVNTISQLVDIDLGSCKKIMLKHAFYLALENSLCQDYITEKFYRSLALGVVPVVFGGVNYTEFAPPNSYIDARDFKTVADLAEHLKSVAKDAERYNDPSKTYPSIMDWYIGNGTCFDFTIPPS